MRKARLRKKGKRYIQAESDGLNVFLNLYNRMYIDWAKNRDSAQERN